jgi:glycosyltransferase involved in cell wall biosynthesis
MGTDQKMRVCHIISGDLWAGAEVQMFTLVNALKVYPELEISAVVLNESALAKKLREIGVEVTVIEESSHSFLQTRSILIEKLKDRVDILHTHRYKENILGALLKNKIGARCLIRTVHGVTEHVRMAKLPKHLIVSALDRYFTTRYFDLVLTVSDDIRNKFSKFIEPDKLLTLHNFIDVANLKPTKAPMSIRDEFGIESDAIVIGSAGRMMPVKAYDVFLDMAEIILRDRGDVKFILAGDGPLRSALQDSAKKKGIDKNVIFPGFRDDIADVLNCFDIFVISSHHEGIPMVLLEAMALRKAIVATAVGGINEIIEDRVSGLQVQAGDSSMLARSCIELMTDAALKESLGDGAYERVCNEFSVESQREKMLAVYKRGFVRG